MKDSMTMEAKRLREDDRAVATVATVVTAVTTTAATRVVIMAVGVGGVRMDDDRGR